MQYFQASVTLFLSFVSVLQAVVCMHLPTHNSKLQEPRIINMRMCMHTSTHSQLWENKGFNALALISHANHYLAHAINKVLNP